MCCISMSSVDNNKKIILFYQKTRILPSQQQALLNMNSSHNTIMPQVTNNTNSTSLPTLVSGISSNSTGNAMPNSNSQQLLATALSAITAALNPQLQQQQSVNFLTENLLSLLTSALITTGAANASNTSTSPSSLNKNLNTNNAEALMMDSYMNVNTDLASASTNNNLLSLPTPPSSASPASPSTSSASSLALLDTNLTAALAFNSNDFCTQYRKRIQQAQERLMQKQQHKQKSVNENASNDQGTVNNYENGNSSDFFSSSLPSVHFEHSSSLVDEKNVSFF